MAKKCFFTYGVIFTLLLWQVWKLTAFFFQRIRKLSEKKIYSNFKITSLFFPFLQNNEEIEMDESVTRFFQIIREAGLSRLWSFGYAIRRSGLMKPCLNKNGIQTRRFFWSSLKASLSFGTRSSLSLGRVVLKVALVAVGFWCCCWNFRRPSRLEDAPQKLTHNVAGPRVSCSSHNCPTKRFTILWATKCRSNCAINYWCVRNLETWLFDDFVDSWKWQKFGRVVL